jgi:hypothetical protein
LVATVKVGGEVIAKGLLAGLTVTVADRDAEPPAPLQLSV